MGGSIGEIYLVLPEYEMLVSLQEGDVVTFSASTMYHAMAADPDMEDGTLSNVGMSLYVNTNQQQRIDERGLARARLAQETKREQCGATKATDGGASKSVLDSTIAVTVPDSKAMSAGAAGTTSAATDCTTTAETVDATAGVSLHDLLQQLQQVELEISNQRNVSAHLTGAEATKHQQALSRLLQHRAELQQAQATLQHKGVKRKRAAARQRRKRKVNQSGDMAQDAGKLTRSLASIDKEEAAVQRKLCMLQEKLHATTNAESMAAMSSQQHKMQQQCATLRAQREQKQELLRQLGASSHLQPSSSSHNQVPVAMQADCDQSEEGTQGPELTTTTNGGNAAAAASSTEAAMLQVTQAPIDPNLTYPTREQTLREGDRRGSQQRSRHNEYGPNLPPGWNRQPQEWGRRPQIAEQLVAAGAGSGTVTSPSWGLPPIHPHPVWGAHRRRHEGGNGAAPVGWPPNMAVGWGRGNPNAAEDNAPGAAAAADADQGALGIQDAAPVAAAAEGTLVNAAAAEEETMGAIAQSGMVHATSAVVQEAGTDGDTPIAAAAHSTVPDAVVAAEDMSRQTRRHSKPRLRYTRVPSRVGWVCDCMQCPLRKNVEAIRFIEGHRIAPAASVTARRSEQRETPSAGITASRRHALQLINSRKKAAEAEEQQSIGSQAACGMGADAHTAHSEASTCSEPFREGNKAARSPRNCHKRMFLVLRVWRPISESTRPI